MNVSFAESFSKSFSISEEGYEVEDNESAQKVIDSAKNALEIQTKSKISVITVERAVGDFCDGYLQLNSDSSRNGVLRFLAEQTVNRHTAQELACQYGSNPESSVIKLEEQLRESLVPPFIKLFQKIGQLPDGKD